MPRKRKKKLPDKFKIDFSNDDGTVDEWVYERRGKRMEPTQVTLNIRRRKNKK